MEITTMKEERLFTRESLLDYARVLVSKPQFTHEDSARANALMALAEKVGDGRRTTSESGPEYRALDLFLRAKKEARDLNLDTMQQDTATSVLVHQGFWGELYFALRQYDRLFDSDVCTVITTAKGAPLVLPFINDVSQSAIAVAENMYSPNLVVGDSRGDPALSARLGIAKTYRTSVIRVSIELAQDSNFKFTDVLIRSFAVRFGRGIGPDLVSALLAYAPLGATAGGSSKSTGGSENGTNSIGWTDLMNLIGSINPAYRALPKCAWLMNADTLLVLDSIITKQGLPLIRPTYSPEGKRLLAGYPIAICPSMDDIGAGKIPIAFGALDYFVVRLVEKETDCQVLLERFAEFGEVAYQAKLRADAVLMGVIETGTSPEVWDGPIKYLQNASE
jgi:HK97 family phage major capsid protein